MWKKRRAQAEKGSFSNFVARSLEIPVHVVEGLPQIELLGNREAVVEHCQGVLEYNSNIVRLRTPKMMLKFTGRGLCLRSMTDDSVIIEGHISSIDFIFQ